LKSEKYVKYVFSNTG